MTHVLIESTTSGVAFENSLIYSVVNLNTLESPSIRYDLKRS
jgi:hypothetical protein